MNIKGVKSVSGMGLMLGVETKRMLSKLQANALKTDFSY